MRLLHSVRDKVSIIIAKDLIACFAHSGKTEENEAYPNEDGKKFIGLWVGERRSRECYK